MRKIFFFNDTATTEIYPLSLHDALPISKSCISSMASYGLTDANSYRATTITVRPDRATTASGATRAAPVDRKTTRLNSSHANISYSVFYLQKNGRPGRKSNSQLGRPPVF